VAQHGPRRVLRSLLRRGRQLGVGPPVQSLSRLLRAHNSAPSATPQTFGRRPRRNIQCVPVHPAGEGVGARSLRAGRSTAPAALSQVDYYAGCERLRNISTIHKRPSSVPPTNGTASGVPERLQMDGGLVAQLTAVRSAFLQATGGTGRRLCRATGRPATSRSERARVAVEEASHHAAPALLLGKHVGHDVLRLRRFSVLKGTSLRLLGC
jgi:hypothetical protein